MEVFLDRKSAFFNGNESNNSDNDDQNYNENNEQQQLSWGFANNCYKIVSPVLPQELINDFAVCKHCTGTLLLVQKQSPRGVKSILRKFAKFTGKHLGQSLFFKSMFEKLYFCEIAIDFI